MFSLHLPGMVLLHVNICILGAGASAGQVEELSPISCKVKFLM